MKNKIAVEPQLTPVKDLLTNKGFQVETLNANSKNLTNYDAIVVTGESSDFLGINDTSTKAVVINADGLTAQQVFDQLKSRLE